MRVAVSKFCSLATSPSWQAWLFHFNNDLYQQFIKRLKVSRGCNDNRGIMTDTLRIIDEIDGGDKLFIFLKKHYPHMLVEDVENKEIVSTGSNDIFPNYNPNILTYPRRLIITGTDLVKKVTNFLIGKIKSDYIIINDKAYIEYLNNEDINVVGSIPAKSWLIAIWRTRSS